MIWESPPPPIPALLVLSLCKCYDETISICQLGETVEPLYLNSNTSSRVPLYSVGASEKNGLSNSKLNKLLIFSGRQEHSVLIRSLEDSLLSEAQESRQIR